MKLKWRVHYLTRLSRKTHKDFEAEVAARQFCEAQANNIRPLALYEMEGSKVKKVILSPCSAFEQAVEK